MAHDDKVFFMVAGGVLLTAVATIILVGVAPTLSAPGVEVAARSAAPAEQAEVASSSNRQLDETATRNHGPSVQEQASAPPLTDRRTSGADWLLASLDLTEGQDVTDSSDQGAARLVRIIDSIAAGSLPENEPGLELPWDRVLVRDIGAGRSALAAGTYRHYSAWVAGIAEPGCEELGSALEDLLAGVGSRSTSAAQAAKVTVPAPEPGSSIEAKLCSAISHLLEVEAPQGPVEMESHVTRWAFAEGSHRSLSPAQKHMLLMGPENAMIVRTKLAELEQIFDCSRPGETSEPTVNIEADRDSSEQPLLASIDPGEPDEHEPEIVSLIAVD